MERSWLDHIESLLVDQQVDLERVLAVLVDELAKAFGADRATFYLVDHASRELVSRAAYLPEIREIRLRLGEGVAGWVGAKGEALRLGELERDPRFSRRIDATTGYQTRSMLCVPVRDQQYTIIGVLQVLNKHEGDFAEQDLTRLVDAAEGVARLLDRTSLRAQLRSDVDKPLSFRFNFIVGESPKMLAVYDRVERAAPTEATVLIRGETGTGKELIARAVHFNSPRRGGKLVKVDCAALPANLIENELFGHEKGAYTGADSSTLGKVAAASGGTLFLDEIAELPLVVQGKLLRLLQDRTYLKVGGSKPQHADVRFVCATHRDLLSLVDQGLFRADLYYRIKVVPIDLPPLRERGHVDLDRLVDHFLYEFGRRHSRKGLKLSREARALIHSWSWPGNVRELEHCIESAVVLSRTTLIEAPALSLDERPTQRAQSGICSLAEMERRHILAVLDHCEGNKTAAAKVLGIGRNTLNRKLEA